jgi:hypothetical protein
MRTITFVAVRESEWHLLRNVSAKLMHLMESNGWWIRATWSGVQPTSAEVFAIANKPSR